MNPIIIPFASIIGVCIGGLISYLTQRQKNAHEVNILMQTNKTDFSAEVTARYFLENKQYPERSFTTLKEKIGGFSDNELRKILVRCGAVRRYRKDKDNNPTEEWWCLLTRTNEIDHSKKAKTN